MKAIDENPKFFDTRLKQLIDNLFSNVQSILPINESLLTGEAYNNIWQLIFHQIWTKSSHIGQILP